MIDLLVADVSCRMTGQVARLQVPGVVATEVVVRRMQGVEPISKVVRGQEINHPREPLRPRRVLALRELREHVGFGYAHEKDRRCVLSYFVLRAVALLGGVQRRVARQDARRVGPKHGPGRLRDVDVAVVIERSRRL